MQNLPTPMEPGSSVAALPWDSALRPLEDFHQSQYSLPPQTRDVECVTTTTVSVRNIMNEYLAHLSNKPETPDLLVDSYVKQLDSMGGPGRIYRHPSNEPPVHLPFVGDISRAGWMHPRSQMLRALDRFASDFKQEYGCTYTVEQSSWNSYADIAQEVRKGNLVIIHLMHDPDPQAPGQFWIGGNPHTFGPVIRMDPQEITLLDTGTDKTSTYSNEEFMKYWDRSSQLRLSPVRWLPKWLQFKVPFYYAYTPPRTMTVITPDALVGQIGGRNMKVKELVGSGDRIGLLVLPFLVIGLILNIMFPSLFGVGGPSTALKVISIILLIPGVIVWIWSALLILTKASQKKLITNGPYSLVKHPLYTGVALLVLPWLGFLFNTWLGALIGLVLYIGSRLFAPEEERTLSKSFGAAWDEYCHKVKMPWL